jgi:hypothetical protein
VFGGCFFHDVGGHGRHLGHGASRVLICDDGSAALPLDQLADPRVGRHRG